MPWNSLPLPAHFHKELHTAVVTFGEAPANLLDRRMVAALGETLAKIATDPTVKAIVLRGSGEQFSFGASVREHLPEEAESMLKEFHAFLASLDADGMPPLMAAIEGRCLGGGLELALACDLIGVTPEAQLGCPEIRLGVFPPAAAALLPLRLGAGRSASLILGGHLIDGLDALHLGLAEVELAPGEAEASALAWIQERLAGHSAAALRHARWAARHPWRRAMNDVLPDLEKRYLQRLMQTEDAIEGLTAFIEKRRPQWSHR